LTLGCDIGTFPLLDGCKPFSSHYLCLEVPVG
jgi:hypothetical protein